jgi:superfamily II DNA/RNA helicase
MSFETLGLSAETLRAAQEAGYTQPTPIQEQAIPVMLSGRDLIGIAQTGTGKTAAFTLPMIDKIASGRAKARMPRCLILEPTRELAVQVSESFEKYGKYQKLTMALLIGGVSYQDQDAKIDRGVDVLIATPGRLLDHFERGKLLLTQVQTLIVDEADRMLDMGFIPDVERICKLLPFTRQTLFFSATMAPEIQRLTDQFLSNPVRIEVSKPASVVDTIEQALIRTPKQEWAKRDVLRHLLRTQPVTNAIVFCNRKTEVAILTKSLISHGFSAGCLHGDMAQPDRLKTLEAFRANNLQVLVASDVAARGLDIPTVSHIFNFDVPINAEDYVHRIGRTGRAGRTGYAFMLSSGEDDRRLAAIEKLKGEQIPVVTLEGYEFPKEQEGAGHSRERGERGKRGDRERRGGARPRARAAAERVAVEVAAPIAEIAPVIAEDVREPTRPKRSKPAQRSENARPAAHARPHRDDDKDRHRGREDHSDRPMLGMGEHVPAFMQIAPTRTRRMPEEAA